jgi:hypothetical protein
MNIPERTDTTMDNRTEARIAALETEINRLKGLLTNEAGDGQGTSSRRGMVKLMAVTAVGAVTGAALLGAQPAAAADLDPVLQGDFNDFVSPTILNCTGNSALICQSDINFGIETDGGVGNALFPATGQTPFGLGATAGTLRVDASGDWWASTFSDLDNGLWRKLASQDSAGQLHLLPTPIRVYDSRPGSEPAAVGPKSQTAINDPRSVDTTLGNTSGVPTTANGVVVTFTIVAPQSGGFATLWPGGPIPSTSNINFVAGQNIATTAIVGCGALATVLVLSNTVTDFIIDVSGYYQ